MSANFYDIKSNWNILEQHLQDPEFIKYANIYRWWSMKPEIGIDMPLIKIGMFDDYGVNEDDVIYVEDKLRENYSIANPYWFCQPCDCQELNSIVTYALFKLAYPEKEWYVATINLDSERVSHIVITDKYIDPNTTLDYDSYLVSSVLNDDVIFYDLIYPLMPWYGMTHSDRSEVNTIYVHGTVKMEEHWKSMNYVSYFDKPVEK